MMQSDGERMGTDRAPLSRGAARAKVFDINRVLEHQTASIGARSCLNDPFEQRRSPVRTQHIARRDQ